MKRGQATLFVLIGILIVAIIAIIVYYKVGIVSVGGEGFIKKSVLLPPEVQNVEDKIDSCVKLSAISGLYLLGVRGGRIVVPEDSLATENFNIAYGYDKGVDVMPEKTVMEGELAEYIDGAVPVCADLGKHRIFNITSRSPKTKVFIEEDEVGVTTNFYVTAQTESSSYKLKDSYSHVIHAKLGRMHDVTKSIIKKEVKEPEYIPLTDFENSGFIFEIKPYTKDLILYSLTDSSSAESPYTFMFAGRY